MELGLLLTLLQEEEEEEKVLHTNHDGQICPSCWGVTVACSCGLVGRWCECSSSGLLAQMEEIDLETRTGG
jgi:hypothetical protein